ncbi:MAG: hypothetical protein MZV70_37735 [Desulfobacterales bacterium]|nr:hypothetical protein [Desulfobacterales bacterium]
MRAILASSARSLPSSCRSCWRGWRMPRSSRPLAFLAMGDESLDPERMQDPADAFRGKPPKAGRAGARSRTAIEAAEREQNEAEVMRLLSEKQKMAVRREKQKMSALREK